MSSSIGVIRLQIDPMMMMNNDQPAETTLFKSPFTCSQMTGVSVRERTDTRRLYSNDSGLMAVGSPSHTWT